MSMAQARATWIAPFPPFSWAGLFLGTLLLLLATPTLFTLFTVWQHNPDYSHGWLLLPVTLWLGIKTQPWRGVLRPQPALGSMTMLAGGLIHLAAQVVHWPLMDYVGWVLLVRGVALCCWGRGAANRLMPVLAYAVLLFPLPMSWLNDLAMLLQDVIAKIAEWGLSLFWVCHRRGHQLQLAGLDEPLSVAVECSGVRQLLVFLALGWLLAFSLRGPVWRKVTLAAASIPIAIAANVLRVFVLAIIARLAGTAGIGGTLHDLPLLITLPLGCLLLWWCYLRLQSSWQAPGGNGTVPMSFPSADPCHKHGYYRSGMITLTAMVALQVALYFHLEGSALSYHVEHVDFETLPWQLGPWRGMPHPEETRVKQQAAFADATLVRAYADDQGRAAAVYLVFSSTGQDRMHHPEICLRDAGGAMELKADRQTVPLQLQPSRLAQRFRYQRTGQQRTVVYYWHYTLAPPASPEQSLLLRLHQKQYDRWPSITIQVQTNMTDPSSWKALETTLLPELDRWLSTKIPVGTQVGTGRLPVRFMVEH